MTLVIFCALMTMGSANVRTKVEDEAYREIHTSYIENGQSIGLADCVEKILRESGATDDFQDFTKTIDPETNSNRLVEHLQTKAAKSIRSFCENKLISYIFTISSSCATSCYHCNLIICLSMFLLLKLK